jgi:hypothetical protein
VQGKFKRAPKGHLYMGIEITEEMKIGLVTKGVCNVLLNFMNVRRSHHLFCCTEYHALLMFCCLLCVRPVSPQKRLGVDVHHSFGDSKGVENPHIVFPLQNIDRLIETPQDQEPPELGTFIEEDAAIMKKRKSTKSEDFVWSTESTYTFTFNTMYIELQTWQAVKLPMMKSLDLHSFWGESDMRMVAYEVPPDKTGNENPHSKKHVQGQLSYVFCTQAAYKPDGDGGAEFEDHTRSLRHESLPWDQVRPRRMRSMVSEGSTDGDSPISDLSNGTQHEAQHTSEKGSDVGSDGFETDSDDGDSSTVSDENANEDESVGGDTVYHDALDISTGRLSLSYSWEVAQRENLFPRDKLCPGWIDFCDSKTGTYSRVFAFVVSKDETFFCAPKYFDQYFAESKAVADIPLYEDCLGDKYHRLSKAEQARRKMGDLFSFVCQSLEPGELEKRIQRLREKWNRYDCSFMHTETFGSPACSVNKKSPRFKSSPENASVTPLGFLARAVSERHWIEQAASMTNHHVVFSHPSRKVSSYRISLGSIIHVRSMSEGDGDDMPYFPTFYFSVIETPGRRIHLMHPSLVQRDEFVKRLSEKIASVAQDTQGSPSYNSRRYVSDDPSQEFLHKSSIWRTKGRRILNCRKFVFNYDQSLDAISGAGMDPCAMVEIALRKGLALHDESSEADLLSFLDSAADLKNANLSDLEEYERKCFFLNMYHLMVVHAYFILGPPNQSAKWASFFNMISYQCADDIFSLAELEHCILRASMSHPIRPFAKFLLPTSKYDNFALKSADFRLNFALNCGSLSNPPTISVYAKQELDLQLDQATRDYLQHVEYSDKNKGGNITLPRICRWYRQDLIDKRDGKGSSDLVQELLPYLAKDTQNDLEDEKASNFSNVQVRFFAYSFRCRSLTLA